METELKVNLWRALSFVLVFFGLLAAFVLVHEATHAQLCLNAGGVAEVSVDKTGFVTICELEGTDLLRRSVLAYGNSLLEVVSYTFGFFFFVGLIVWGAKKW